LTEFARAADGDPSNHLRATYSFELGTWKATCRACGWQISDANRRRAAARFRLHHKNLAGPPAEPLGVPGELPEDGPAVVLVQDRR
jgi:hypothetical protein